MANQEQSRMQSNKNQSAESEIKGAKRAEGKSIAAASTPTKSIGAVIGESLAEDIKDTQERVDQIMDKVSEYFQSAKDYVTENPKETVALVASVGVAAWALLYTKPGRQVFEKGSAVLVPRVSKWITENFASPGSSVVQH